MDEVKDIYFDYKLGQSTAGLKPWNILLGKAKNKDRLEMTRDYGFRDTTK